ncbi:MAG: RecQ family ATP-dependent DNA helicase [Anaeroplasmataceae bacterium]
MKYKLLKEIYGYSEFRDSQDKIIDSIISKKDTLAILKTGAGKSVCFQIPALIFKGVTIVVTPLISLMINQVEELRKIKISACHINSSITKQERLEIFSDLRRFKIIYLSPESLTYDLYTIISKQVEVSQVVIDEAHTINWHKEFRPSFKLISRFVDYFSVRPVVLAFTATANTKTILEIKTILNLRNSNTFIGEFDRKELYYSVVKNTNKIDYIYNYIKKRTNDSGIIYCNTIKDVMMLYNHFSKNGFNVTYYHGNLDVSTRKINQEKFISDNIKLIVCTISFGMGINKPNIRYVINYDLPQTLNDLAQMIGRCSRDRKYGEAIILYNKKDIKTNMYFINKSSSKLFTYNLSLFKDVYKFVRTKKCLHMILSKEFNEILPKCKKMCSNCNKNKIF